MKIFAFLFLFGVASASVYKELDEAADGLVQSFLQDVEDVPLLTNRESQYSNAIEEETKSELGKHLKEALKKVLEKVKEEIDKGKIVRDELLEKVRELREQLKELKVKLGDEGEHLIEKIKEKAREYLRKLLDKLGKHKRSVHGSLDKALSELNIRDILKKVKEHLKNNVDPNLLKQIIEKLFGQASELLEQLLHTLKEKGRRKLMILIDQILDDDDDKRKKRGWADYWEKVKNYFKDLHIDLQEKYMKFGEWVKTTMDKGMEHSKNKIENIKAIATEFVKHAKGISKEVATEAGEFFKNYKNDLGDVWEDLKEKIKEIRNRKD